MRHNILYLLVLALVVILLAMFANKRTESMELPGFRFSAGPFHRDGFSPGPFHRYGFNPGPFHYPSPFKGQPNQQGPRLH